VACDVQTRVFKGCREEILALTEVRGVKNNRVHFVAIIDHFTSCASPSQQQVDLCELCMQPSYQQSDGAGLTDEWQAVLQARQLFKAGIRSPECIAKSSPAELAVILRQGAAGMQSLHATSSCLAPLCVRAGFTKCCSLKCLLTGSCCFAAAGNSKGNELLLAGRIRKAAIELLQERARQAIAGAAAASAHFPQQMSRHKRQLDLCWMVCSRVASVAGDNWCNNSGLPAAC
jgi:hypothetical protein